MNVAELVLGSETNVGLCLCESYHVVECCFGSLFNPVLSLQAYSISGSDKMSSFGGYVWHRFSDATRELLRPLLVSLYSKSDRPISVHKIRCF